MIVLQWCSCRGGEARATTSIWPGRENRRDPARRNLGGGVARHSSKRSDKKNQNCHHQSRFLGSDYGKKCYFGQGSTPDTTGGVYNAPQTS